MTTPAERLRFFWGFVRHPRTVGSVLPSSRYLASAVAGAVPANARCVAELGPGTGPITRALLDHLHPDAALLALEIDPAFCDLLRRQIPDRRLHVVQAPAQQIATHAAALGRPVEGVVSGLPFANFPVMLRREIVQAVYDALPPGGVFSGYGYAPFALPPLLREIFGNCRLGFVWRNVPPAFTVVARKRG